MRYAYASQIFGIIHILLSKKATFSFPCCTLIRLGVNAVLTISEQSLSPGVTRKKKVRLAMWLSFWKKLCLKRFIDRSGVRGEVRRCSPVLLDLSRHLSLSSFIPQCCVVEFWTIHHATSSCKCLFGSIHA